MITTCTVCQARYQLDAEKIPARVIKVRCPACSGVFSLDGTKIPREAPMAVAAKPEPVAPAPQPKAPACFRLPPSFLTVLRMTPPVS